jgi:DeoR/GlpR family transcriptional regulator of sugar metabolism
MRDTITTADLADMLGVTTRTIRDLAKQAIMRPSH